MNNRIASTNHILSDHYEQRSKNIGAKRKSAYGGMNQFICKTNPILSHPLICSFTHILINSSTHTLFYSKRTQFPNTYVPEGTPKHRQNTKIVQILPKTLEFIPARRETFLYFSKKIQKNTRLLYFSDINILNSMYNKDLHNFFTPEYSSREEFTHRICDGKKCKTNPISKLQKSSIKNRASKKCKTNPISLPKMSKRSGDPPMADKTNPILSHPLIYTFTQEFIRQGRTHSLIYAKRTQSNQRAMRDKLCKTNPI